MPDQVRDVGQRPMEPVRVRTVMQFVIMMMVVMPAILIIVMVMLPVVGR